MVTIALRPALLAAVSIYALGATALHAQTTAAAPAVAPVADDEILVTGFRQSLQNALNAKRDSNLIIESITAEDIGKFPDQNVAESLQRLPGIQIDRSNGQGTRVRIRGLEQNVTLLDGDIFLTGLELFKVGEGNFQQGDSLEGVPSELIGGVDVYKSPNASLLEGGLGGIVDLKTRNPLDLKEGLTIGGNARLGNVSGSNSWKPTGAVVAGYNFNDRVAIIASFSYAEQDFHTNVLGGDNRGNWRFAERADSATVPNYYAPEYRYITDRDQERKRWGASIGIGFRPTDELSLDVEYFHQQLDITTSEASVKFPFAPGEGRGLVPGTAFEIDDNGVLLGGTVRSQSAEAISFVDKSKIRSDNVQFNGKWDDGGNFRASFKAAYSTADQERNVANNDVRYTAYSVPTANAASPTGFSHQPANPAAPATFDFIYDNRDGKLPSFGLGSNSPQDLFNNPAYGFFKSHWAFGDRSDLKNYSLRGDLAWDARGGGTGTITISSGFRYAQRTVDFASGRYLADYSSKGEVDASALPAAVKAQYPNYQFNWTPLGYFQDGAIGFKSCELPIASLRPNGCDNRFGNSPPLITPFQTFTGSPDRVEQIKNFAGGGVVAGDTVLVQDRSQMGDALKWIQALYPSTPFAFYENPLETFRVKEETKSGYIMADLGGKDDSYHVNIGVRIVNTELRVEQNSPANADPVYYGTDSWNGVLRDFSTSTVKRSYTDFLPSVNVVADITEGQKVRFSAARVVARQNLFDLGRGFATDFTRNATTNLFEFTSGSSGNPDLDPFRAYQFDAAYELYMGRQGLFTVGAFWKEIDSFVASDTTPVFVNDQAGGRFGPVTRPVNGTGGRVRGIEVGAQYALDFGLGFNLNYTFSDSKTDRSNDFDQGLPLPGVSKHSANGQIYFEKAGFEARASYSWRSKAYTGNFGFRDLGITRTLGIYSRPYGQLDGQVSYQFTPNFGVLVEGINLTKANQSSYLQFPNLPFTYQSGARRVLVGGRFSF